MRGGFSKIVERWGLKSLWKGNMTLVLHRFPYSAINCYVYENTSVVLVGMQRSHRENTETYGHLKRRLSHTMTETELQEERRLQEKARNDDNRWCTSSWQEPWRVAPRYLHATHSTL